MWTRIIWAIVTAVVILLFVGGWGIARRYRTEQVMLLPVEEMTAEQYPDDPAHYSRFYGRYNHRRLKLVDLGDGHFDFIFESDDPHVAQITFKDVDVGLFTPTKPSWMEDRDLTILTLVEREWNRQQVSFAPDSSHVEVSGGDGFEKQNLYTLVLARNCLNAGLWEIMLYTMEGGQQSLLYQGWFELPIGHYKDLFESQNGIAYWKHWHRMEHWIDPEGRSVDLEQLRTVTDEGVAPVQFNPQETVPSQGEQARKERFLDTGLMLQWRDYPINHDQIEFPTFAPPGRYDRTKPWNNRFQNIETVKTALVRQVIPRGGGEARDEIELVFEGPDGQTTRLVISGIEIDKLPIVSPDEYSKGWMMPLGIAIPPNYQPYEELKANPPHLSPYFSALLDDIDRWINHHEAAIDGIILFRDAQNPDLLHIYLLSYERHRLVGHYTLDLDKISQS